MRTLAHMLGFVIGFVHANAGWILLLGGGLLAVTAGIHTFSPNGGSLLGVLIALWGAWLLMRGEVDDVRRSGDGS